MRNFRDLREKLLRGELEKVVVRQLDGSAVFMAVENSLSAFEKLKLAVRKSPIILMIFGNVLIG